MRAFTAILVLLVLATPVDAGYSFEVAPSHPDWEPGIEALQRNDWDGAITHLSQVILNEPGNADARNALGFAYLRRKQTGEAFRHLRESLRLDPGHRSAHENIGEAYLQTRNRAKAREHLASLERLCGKGCEEYQRLAKSLAAVK